MIRFTIFFRRRTWCRDGSEVDVAGLAIGFAQVLEALGDFSRLKMSPSFMGKGCARRHVRNGFVVLESDGAQAIARALLDGHGDIDGLSHAGLKPGNMEAFVSGVVDFGLGIVDQHLEVAAVLELGTDALGIFFELGGVVGFGEKIFEEDGVRDADGLEVLHGRTQSAVIDMLVAAEADVANLDLGPLFDDEGDADGSGRDGTDFGADGGELAPVLGEQFLEHDFGLLDLGGIVLALDRESDLAVFEAVEHVAGGDGIETGVVDLADGGALFEVNVQDPALGVLFALEADVFKVAGVPERVEVAFDGGRCRRRRRPW
jgi:hypothetical protein